MNNIPVLFTTYNRLDYTKKSLKALYKSKCGVIIVIDNASTDGTQEWIMDFCVNHPRIYPIFHDTNEGVRGAMQHFFDLTSEDEFVAKVDNDTIVPNDWLEVMHKKMERCGVDIMQAKHPILPATFAGGNFDEWMTHKTADPIEPSVHYSSFVGGSGVLIRRDKIIERLPRPENDWVLGGWIDFQRQNPQLKKAFCTEVEIKLLDMKKEGGANYSKYPEYYKETKRL